MAYRPQTNYLLLGFFAWAMVACGDFFATNQLADSDKVAPTLTLQIAPLPLGINHLTALVVQGDKITEIVALEHHNLSWRAQNSAWLQADSVILWANLSLTDQAMIKPSMELKAYRALAFSGSINRQGVQPPFLMQGVVHKEELTQTPTITLRPMVATIQVNNPHRVQLDELVAEKSAPTVAPTATPIASDYTVEIPATKEPQCTFYLYPSKELTLLITHGNTTITKRIASLGANTTTTIEIEQPDPKPEQPTKFTFTIGNTTTNVEQGALLSLPSLGAGIWAYLPQSLDLRLKTDVYWVKQGQSLAAPSSMRLVASFSRRTIEEQVASTRYVFDDYFVPNSSRTATFEIINRASLQALTALDAVQQGVGRVKIESTVSVIPQLGGTVECRVKSSWSEVELEAPAAFNFIERTAIGQEPYAFEYLYKYRIEPSTASQATPYRLIARNAEHQTADTLLLTQAPIEASTDRTALLAIFDKLGGPEWATEAKTNWGSGYPMGQWAGVTTNSAGRVVGLNLPAQSNIKGDFPTAITELTALEQLAIGANAVGGKFPTEIGKLKALKKLHTTGNKMGGDLPRSMGELTSLADLNIARQYHTGEIWKEFQRIPAYKAADFTQKVRTQYLSGTTTEIELPIETPENTMKSVTLGRNAQRHVISLPGDVAGQSYHYTSSPTGNTLALAYKTNELIPGNTTMIEATLAENNTGGAITYTINVSGRNRTTGITENYTYTIEQTTEKVERKDGDVRVFLDNNRAYDKSYGLVFMGDGFLLEDLQPGGDYDERADHILNYIFSKEPFATYKDYFKIYVVYVESKKIGLGGKLGTWYNPSTGYPEVNNEQVRSYAKKAPSSYIFARLVAMNIYDPGTSSGLTINEMNALFQARHEHTALHEFAHIFKLGDEYDYGGFPGVVPNVKSIPNLDNTGDLNRVKWKHFIGLPGYEDVGAFEGGAYKPTGVWRPENHSIMKNYHKDFNHFNAPSREALVKKILYYAEEPYSFAEFLRLDKKTKQPPFNP